MQEKRQTPIPLFGSKYEPIHLTFEDIQYEKDEREVPVWNGTLYVFERKVRAYMNITPWPKSLNPLPFQRRNKNESTDIV